jgi:hypothetical protein
MSKFNEQNLEDRWRKEMESHAPLPSTEDWQGMTQLLDRNTPASKQGTVEPESNTTAPQTINKKTSSRLRWLVWGGMLLLAMGLGIWFISLQGERNHPSTNASIETNATIISHDSFPPHYVLDRYWTYDRDGNTVGEMHSDTVWMDHTVRKRGRYALLSPGKVADFRIDTIFRISGRGDLQSVRYDTAYINGTNLRQVPGPNDHRERAIYRFDTIYQLDTLGNLTGRIHAIDTTISYLPVGTI